MDEQLKNIANPSFWEQFLSVSALIIALGAFIFSVLTNRKQVKLEQEKSEKYVVIMNTVINKAMSEILQLIQREQTFISNKDNRSVEAYVRTSITYTSNEISSRYELLNSFSFFDLEPLNADYLYEAKTIMLGVVNYFIATERKASTDKFSIIRYKKNLIRFENDLKTFIDENK